MENPFSMIESQVISMTFQDYMKLPWHPGFKLEYFGGRLHISPRWRTYDLFLPLEQPEECSSVDVQNLVEIRQLEKPDWNDLPRVFASSFGRSPPFSLIPESERDEAGRRFMEFTRSGGDGPLIPEACFIAAHRETGNPLGAVILGQMTGRDKGWHDEARDAVSPPPPPLPPGAAGPPHLNWIFVTEFCHGEGVGTALLAKATRALWDLGYRELASTVNQGNDPGMVWHWARGFRLLPRWDRRRRGHKDDIVRS
jgi:GNAT superfamily N-acetyltransferase